MTDEKVEKNTNETKVADKPQATTGAPRGNREPREFKKNRRSNRRRRDNARSEFDQRILDIRRVTRVSSGGRRFSFSVAMVIGDKKGQVGVGTGKAGDTALAIEKAVKDAKKSLVKVNTTSTGTITHRTDAKYSSAQVIMMPAPGRGVVAGSALRDVLVLAGIKDVNGKIISGSKNKLNIAKATIKALSSLSADKYKKTVKAVKKEAK